MSAAYLQKALDYSSSEGREASIRSFIGASLAADWRQALVARGYGWHADAGAFSTPAAGGGAAAVIDQDRPNLLISVASGYTLIPLRIHVTCQTPLIANDSDESEILIAADVSAAAAGITTQTTVETPVNMRTNVTTGCPATVYSTLSANITNPTLGLELAHAVTVGDVNGTAANALWGQLELLYEPVVSPFIVGPACLYVYHGGTVATTGFINADFLVIASTLVTSLS